MSSAKLMLDYVYAHELALANQVLLTQPTDAGQVRDYSWAQTMDQARRMAQHLRSLSLQPGARIAILSKNCAHSFIAELAIWLAGGSTVAIFPSETAHTIRYVLEHSGASLLFVGKLDQWEQQAAGIPSGLPCIAMPLAPATPFESWDSITLRTRPLTGKVMRAGHELAMLMYTSGSTGEPKGVMHSFAAITAASVGMCDYLQRNTGAAPELRVLSYLPLAHVYERAWVECTALVNGRIRVFFAESQDTFLQDLQRARPTVFSSVPRLWQKFQQGVYQKVKPSRLQLLLRIPLVRQLVGRRVRKGLGLDQVLLAASGSAPIAPELVRWYRRLGLNLMEGYGMTEDFAYSHVSAPGFSQAGCVGVALPGVQLRIAEDGELLLKSPGQMLGYYRQPERTAEVIDADGFFHTGDRGERTAQGLLRLTGRTKELFKTAKGKYVAPVPIENLLSAHPLIEQSMVSGVGQVAAYGLVVLAEAVRARLQEPALRQQVENELAALLQQVNRGLAEYERLRMLVVSAQEWTVDNGLLTPTLKIRRNRIEALVQPQLAQWYASPGPLCWAR